MHDVARACRFVWSEALEFNVMELTRFFPTDEERIEFSHAVRRDMENQAYHWYSLLYIDPLILIDVSDMLLWVGRHESIAGRRHVVVNCLSAIYT